MFSLFLTNKCKKSLLKIRNHKKFKKEVFDEVIKILLSGQRLPAQYREHKLSGWYEGCYECHIQNDILLIYSFEKEKCILFVVDIGTHSDLF